jgi:SAM-dependent methyltransferase/uncharacterized protein YbaR (Trm112 family)
MRAALLSLLRCPISGARLKAISLDSKCGPDGVDIRAGLLQSEASSHFYPIVQGVPVMLPRSVPASFLSEYAIQLKNIDGFSERCVSDSESDWSFSSEWQEFAKRGLRRTWSQSVEERIDMLLLEMQLERQSLQHTLVLDAGCGNGSMIDAIGALGATAIGIDFSTSVFGAEARRQSRNTHFVRGDLLNPPFGHEQFEFIYAYGVLHHTKNPQRTFSSVAGLVKKQGKLFVWLYRWTKHPKFLAVQLFGELIRPIGSRAPEMLQAIITRSYAAVQYGLLRLIGGGRWHNTYSDLVVHAYDSMTPRWAHRQSPIQVASWFFECGFAPPRLTHWDHPNGFGLLAEKSQQSDTPGFNFGRSAVAKRFIY